MKKRVNWEDCYYIYERFQHINEANGLFSIILTVCVHFKRKGALTAVSIAMYELNTSKKRLCSIRAMFVRNFRPFHIMHNVPRDEQGSYSDFVR